MIPAVIPAVARLEVASALRARWFLAALLLSAGLVAFFVVVAQRESALVGFTGYGRVLTGVVQASLTFLPLLALFSTAQAVTGASQSGALEWYLSYPNSRSRCFWAIFLPRLAAVTLPVAAATLLLGLLGALMGQGLSAGVLAGFLVLLVGQSFCFSGLGVAISALSATPESALLRALGVWISAAALVDFLVLGVLLRWQLPAWAVFALAGLNPVQAGRLGMLARTDPELGVLGPVGTWMSTTLGPPLTQLYGFGWPVLVGLIAVLVGHRAFSQRDL